MWGPPYWGPSYWGHPYWPSGAPAPIFAPGLVASDPETVGVWRIDRWQTGTPKATIALRDLTSQTKATLPLRVFSRDDYPLADESVIGEPIPAGFGVVQGAAAFQVDTATKRFKVFDHSVASFGAFYTSDGATVTPTTIDLVNGEFTWAAWVDEEIFADAVLTLDNPIDVVKELLTSSTRGASVPATQLGSGFGASGARLKYVRGTVPTDGDREVASFAIGLYLDTPKGVFEWVQQVLVASFSILYTDRGGLYQIKAWAPHRREDVGEITIDQVVPGTVRPLAVASDPVTKARVRYATNHGLGNAQVVEYESDELRQLRGLAEHATLDRTLPLSERFGAAYWTERAVAMRGVPRRTISLTVTQEHSALEPGDGVALVYSPLGIDSVWEVVSSTIRPGASTVSLVLIDSRGFGDGAGWWTPDAGAFAFPADLGGGTITAWSAAWTDPQKKWYRENWGVWVLDTGYADVLDPSWSFRGSRWV